MELDRIKRLIQDAMWEANTGKTLSRRYKASVVDDALEELARLEAAQHSVQSTDGSLRDLQASSKPPYSTNPKPDLGKPISG